jgi:hypothetical protein
MQGQCGLVIKRSEVRFVNSSTLYLWENADLWCLPALFCELYFYPGFGSVILSKKAREQNPPEEDRIHHETAAADKLWQLDFWER